MPKFVRKDVTISPIGSAVEVEVTCGFGHDIRFDAELFDNQGNNPQTLHTGSSLSTAAPPFVINVIPSQLPGRFLMITGDVFHLGISDNLQVDLIIRQNGQEVDRLTAVDTFTDNESVRLVARFQ